MIRKIQFIIIILIFPFTVFSQLTDADKAAIEAKSTQIANDLNNLMNSLSDKNKSKDDCAKLMNGSYMINSPVKIFEDGGVVMQDDIDPSHDHNKTDYYLDVEDYFNEFRKSFSADGDHPVAFSEMSAVFTEQTESTATVMLSYKSLFTGKYTGEGDKFYTTRNRMMKIHAVKTSGTWKTQIVEITFRDDKAPKEVVKGVVIQTGAVDSIIMRDTSVELAYILQFMDKEKKVEYKSPGDDKTTHRMAYSSITAIIRKDALIIYDTISYLGYRGLTMDQIMDSLQKIRLAKKYAAAGVHNTVDNTPGVQNIPKMVLIDGGDFLMGRDSSFSGDEDELPMHLVHIRKFYMSDCEITVKQFREFMRKSKYRSTSDSAGYSQINIVADNRYMLCRDCNWETDSLGQWLTPEHDKDPVRHVSWSDAMAYCDWLGKTTSNNFRLPTEAEWEFAARGKDKTNYYMYSGSDSLTDISWTDTTSNTGSVHPVGTKKPNDYGLYDMTGNVQEWCLDWYASDYYLKSPDDNPRGPDKATNKEKAKVFRGGSFKSDSNNCRVENRTFRVPLSYDDVGFRIILEVKK